MSAASSRLALETMITIAPLERTNSWRQAAAPEFVIEMPFLRARRKQNLVRREWEPVLLAIVARVLVRSYRAQSQHWRLEPWEQAAWTVSRWAGRNRSGTVLLRRATFQMMCLEEALRLAAAR